MNIQFSPNKVSGTKADIELVFVLPKNMKHKWVRDEAALKDLGFKAEEKQTAFLPHKRKIYACLASFDDYDLREGAAAALNALKKTRFKSLKVGLYGATSARALSEGFILGSYTFERYKSKPEKSALNRVVISAEDYEGRRHEPAMVKADIRLASIMCEAANYTKDIVNRPPAEITPVKMAEIAKDMAKEKGLEIKVRGEKYLEQEGMGAFLAVSKASPYPPQLIHLVKRSKDAKKVIVLVGKGLTFDTGGLSLKPSNAMLTMKSDKSGASAILGIMRAVADLDLPYEIHGIIGATENILGRHAYKPDDILRAKNGKTIEVVNTDAEGRLVLADCLAYAQEQSPDYIVDLATLTGACVIALGEYTVGVMGFNEELKSEIMDAGSRTGELTGNLPFNKHLPALLKSDVADMANCSKAKYGGAITAALFLSEFVDKKNRDKWVHLDIAGPAFVEKPWSWNQAGASGAGVRMVTDWLLNLGKNQE